MVEDREELEIPVEPILLVVALTVVFIIPRLPSITPVPLNPISLTLTVAGIVLGIVIPLSRRYEFAYVVLAFYTLVVLVVICGIFLLPAHYVTVGKIEGRYTVNNLETTGVLGQRRKGVYDVSLVTRGGGNIDLNIHLSTVQAPKGDYGDWLKTVVYPILYVLLPGIGSFLASFFAVIFIERLFFEEEE